MPVCFGREIVWARTMPKSLTKKISLKSKMVTPIRISINIGETLDSFKNQLVSHSTQISHSPGVEKLIRFLIWCRIGEIWAKRQLSWIFKVGTASILRMQKLHVFYECKIRRNVPSTIFKWSSWTSSLMIKKQENSQSIFDELFGPKRSQQLNWQSQQAKECNQSESWPARL